MASRRIPRRAAPAVILFSIASLLVGCPGASRVEILPAADAREALGRVTSNLNRIDGALNCTGLVTFKFRDTEGQSRSFLAQGVAVVVDKPHHLLMAIRHGLGDTLAQIGANNEHYWLWVNLPELQKLWWGTWAGLEANPSPRIVVTPRQLLDAWLLTPIENSLPDGDPPLLLVQGGDRWLVFTMRDADGWPGVRREMHLDAKPPHLPLRIVDRNAEGKIVMDARLSGYRRIDDAPGDAPYTPRSYFVEWPADEAELRLDFDSVKYRTTDLPYNEFPDGWKGEKENLDEPALPMERMPAED